MNIAIPSFWSGAGATFGVVAALAVLCLATFIAALAFGLVARAVRRGRPPPASKKPDDVAGEIVRSIRRARAETRAARERE